jgi:uncharacterized protein YqgC (DUF456 family)
LELALIITVGILFALIGLVCVGSVVVGLPGAWIMLAIAVVIELADGAYLDDRGPDTFGWWPIALCAILAAVGELFEFIAGALGAKTAGSSRRGMIGALVGGIAGAILGVALPPPVIGSLIGAVAGTFAGAIVGELANGRESTVRAAMRPATGATIGRIVGTLSKVPLAAVIWLVLTIGALWP